MTNYTPPAEAVEAGARAMADDWNPDRDPILTAMFRDYAMSALTAAGPIIAAEALRDAAETLRAEDRTHVGYGDWLERRGARLARGEGS